MQSWGFNGGGHMWYLWNFYKTFGHVLEEDYTYTGDDSSCKYG